MPHPRVPLGVFQAGAGFDARPGLGGGHDVNDDQPGIIDPAIEINEALADTLLERCTHGVGSQVNGPG